MKKCPFCAEEIQDAAIVCRYCGRDLSEAKKGFDPSWTVLWLAFFGALALLVAVFSYVTHSGQNGSAAANRVAGSEAREACTTAKAAVRKLMLEPSGAEFQEPCSRIFTRRDGEDWLVSSTVESKNRFGVKVRMEWTARVAKYGSEWGTRQLLIDGKQAYP